MIKEILRNEDELKAREISSRIWSRYHKKVSKKEINAILYSYENVYFFLCGDFRWRMFDNF